MAATAWLGAAGGGVKAVCGSGALSGKELSRRLAEAQLSGLTERIWAAAEELQSQKATTGAELSAKFASEGGTFQMAFGSLSMFFGGLVMLIGPPKMVDGSLLKAMRLEHCGQKDSAVPFKICPAAW